MIMKKAADIGMNEWIRLRYVIHDDHGQFFVNDTMLLDIEHMFHGTGEAGGIGLFTDIGSEAFFKDLEIIPED